jgi:hypothetical protein
MKFVKSIGKFKLRYCGKNKNIFGSVNDVDQPTIRGSAGVKAKNCCPAQYDQHNTESTLRTRGFEDASSMEKS